MAATMRAGKVIQAITLRSTSVCLFHGYVAGGPTTITKRTRTEDGIARAARDEKHDAAARLGVV